MKNIILSIVATSVLFAGESGFGVYDIMPSTGSEYCAKAPSELNCCSGVWTDPKTGAVHSGGMWRIGENAETCQESMFTAILVDYFFERYTTKEKKELKEEYLVSKEKEDEVK